MADNNTTTPAAQPTKSKAEILTDVYTLANQFSTCVEAFNLIHPSKDNDHAQKVALVKLGLQQGRLLIFGDAVGIAAPPPTIARHMIPSHPGITNPDPHLPVNFGVRDTRLDDIDINQRIRKALNEIAGRPGNLPRDELMDKYGLKSPKHFSRIEYPALVTNRLEGFREKYALLQDLVRQMGVRASVKRNMSMTTSHWTVKNSVRFDQFVKTVRLEVDALIDLMGVKEQVDRGTRSDIRCMAWHPDLTGPVVKQDWEKLRLIREACEVDYPEYIEVVDTALQYINEELKESSLAARRASYSLAVPTTGAAGARRKSDYDIRTAPPEVQAEAKSPTKAADKTHIQLAAERALDPNSGKEKRPSIFSAFKFKSWSKSNKNENRDKQRSKSVPDANANMDAQRSLSDAVAGAQPCSSDEINNLEPIRSKSLSAIPDAPAPLDLESRMKDVSLDDQVSKPVTIPEDSVLATSPATDGLSSDIEKNALVQTDTMNSEGSTGTNGLYGATTVNSLIDRHDMYKGMGRIETKDIRAKAHEFGG